MKKRAVLLEPFKNLVAVNGTVLFGVKPNKEVEEGQEEGRVPVGGAKVEENEEEGHVPAGGAKMEENEEEGRVPAGGVKVEENQEEGHSPVKVKESQEEGRDPIGGANLQENPEDRRGPVGGARKLLSFMGAEGEGDEERESRHLAEMVAIAKMKELNRERDLRKAVEEWEKKYGEWVSASSVAFCLSSF